MSSIYSQMVQGKHRKIKDYSSLLLLLIYFGCSWIRWPREGQLPDQAIMIDLANRKGYLFGIQIWPEEVYYIAAILIMAALGLFFVTSLFGRIWCGYTCPHTVFVDLFIKVESFFQGDRNARIKLDCEPLTSEKLMKKALTHIVWVLIAFSFAFGWVCYFYNAPVLACDIVNFQVTSSGSVWLIGLTVSTYLFAGFIREKVCSYMCPYGRFQSAMLDNNSSVVTYHDWRGDPRGKFDPSNKNLGDCIDCGKCVVVCPMGIDIRNGLQLACIGCGLCVDACNSVMERLSRPLGLIDYDSIDSSKAKKEGSVISRKVTYLKAIIFLIIFAVISSGVIFALLHKPTTIISVIRERDALFTLLPDGSYRNHYTIKIVNHLSVDRRLDLNLKGLESAEIKINNYSTEYGTSYDFNIKPEEELELDVFVKLRINNDDFNPRNFLFVVKDKESSLQFEHQTVFITKR